jgi:hypothetical protein
MCYDIIYDIIYDGLFAQDCVVLPYPNNQNPVKSFNVKTNFDLQGDALVWYARPQLFLNCTSCLTGTKGPLFSESHKEVSLMYFSRFAPIYLTLDTASWSRLECHVL